MNPEPWDPTPAQEEAAIRLADSLIAARGRNIGDGTVELRTLQETEVRRYVIYQTGQRLSSIRGRRAHATGG